MIDNVWSTESSGTTIFLAITIVNARTFFFPKLFDRPINRFGLDYPVSHDDNGDEVDVGMNDDDSDKNSFVENNLKMCEVQDRFTTEKVTGSPETSPVRSNRKHFQIFSESARFQESVIKPSFGKTLFQHNKNTALTSFCGSFKVTLSHFFFEFLSMFV